MAVNVVPSYAQGRRFCILCSRSPVFSPLTPPISQFFCNGIWRQAFHSSAKYPRISPKFIIRKEEAEKAPDNDYYGKDSGGDVRGGTPVFNRTIEDGKYGFGLPDFVPAHIKKPSYASHPRGIPLIHSSDNGGYDNPQGRTGAVAVSSGLQQEHIDGMYKAGELARQCLHIALENTKVGATTLDLNKIVHEHIINNGAYPAAINFYQFPKSMCASVNEVACHGIPCDRPLEWGDMASFDCTVFLDGLFGDCCGTTIVGENCDLEYTNPHPHDDEDTGMDSARKASMFQPGSRKIPPLIPLLGQEEPLTGTDTKIQLDRHIVHRVLNEVTHECLIAAIEQVGPGMPLDIVAETISKYLYAFNERYYSYYYCRSLNPGSNRDTVDETRIPRYGFQVVEQFCGHFIGTQMHMEPTVRHFTQAAYSPVGNPYLNKTSHSNSARVTPQAGKTSGYILKENDIFTIEPVIVEGSKKVYTFKDDWSVCTLDNGFSSQWEHTVIITKNGSDVLTRLKHPFVIPRI